MAFHDPTPAPNPVNPGRKPCGSPVPREVLLVLVLVLAFVLVRDDVRHQLQRSFRDGHDLLDGLELILRGVDGGVFGHHVAVVRRIRATRGLERPIDSLESRFNVPWA